MTLEELQRIQELTLEMERNGGKPKFVPPFDQEHPIVIPPVAQWHELMTLAVLSEIALNMRFIHEALVNIDETLVELRGK